MRLAQLKARADDPEQTAGAVFPRLIYGPDHPYGRPDLGTPESVQSITRDDAIAFYRQIMVPGNAAMVVVGDVQARCHHRRARNAVASVGPRPGPSAPCPLAHSGVSPRQAALPDRQTVRGAVGPDRRQDRGRAQIAAISTPWR